ncbi:hypothetical protein [Sulfitobacter guttiformis]|uniref:Gp37 protein n=1 Tax=Sulfitobacter guttiformis TaxID=74349 RepID=A0A420DHA0_9RHOB|nr:hypothetical protein [Sulfitobacter guttiformis]KIN72670.1 hypothetical protein Z949_1848 [Sulfitobacter guttiformis KCTC 32187]RKE93602.1 hypothetical protein C8N30_2679 [Sulfitobacter guttiformis]
MHPRTKIKDQIKDILSEAFPDVNVYVNLLGEVDPSFDEVIIVYVPDETTSRVNGKSTGMTGAPLKRLITVEIVASILLHAVTPEEEEIASDRSNALARKIGLCINNNHVALEPKGERQEHDIGDVIRIANVMTYQHEINDLMDS